MKQIINSILDNDLYKFTMQQAVRKLYPDVFVTYKFKNRGTQRFNYEFANKLKEQIYMMGNLQLQTVEWFKLKTIPFLEYDYINWLKFFKLDPNDVIVKLTEDNNLDIEIVGKWKNTILWEVPLMALISELYFEQLSYDDIYNVRDGALLKGNRIGLPFAEFGTRRRRSRLFQKNVIERLIVCKNYVGTSNVKFALDNNEMPIGTMAHEWIMGVSVLEGLRNANRFAMQKWHNVYHGRLGIVLPDTFTSDVFFKDFDRNYANMYDGIRWDSGDYKEFTDKVINKYEELNINPKTKTIVYSDGINSFDMCNEIKNYRKDEIKKSLGIGTWFTNDWNTPPLNMVIKLNTVNKVPVFKMSDSPGKVMGDEDAIKSAEWVFKTKMEGI